MLAKKYRISRKKDIINIFQKGKYFYNSVLSVKVLKNNLPYSRFVFSVGLKISKKAVQRNRIKRLLNEIVRKNLTRIIRGHDVMLMPQKNILDHETDKIEKMLLNLLEDIK